MPRPVARVALLLAVFTPLGVAYTWPLARGLSTAFLHPTPAPHPLEQADTFLNSWILAWDVHQLLHDPRRLFDANIFHPLPNALALGEHILGGALLVLPIDVLWRNAILDHNALVLASYVLGGVGTTLLVRDLGGSTAAALAGGALFAFNPIRIGQLGHVQTLCTHWMPFALLGLQRLLRTGRWLPGAGFAACLLLEALSSVYYAYYFGIAVVLFLGLHAAWRCPAAPRAYRRAVGFGLLVLLALVPTFLPYLAVREQLALERPAALPVLLSAVGENYLGGILSPLEYLRRRFVTGPPGYVVFGPGALGLAVLGVARGATTTRGGRRIALAYASLAVLLAVVSLGPSMRLYPVIEGGVPGPYALLLTVVPGLGALRVPARAGAVTVLAVAVLAALGADALLRAVRSRSLRAAGAVLVVAITLAECWRPRLYAVPGPRLRPLPGVYRWLAEQPGDFAIAELPLGSLMTDARWMLYSTTHWKRLVNGYGWSPTDAYLRATFARLPDGPGLRLLGDLDVRYLVVHEDLAAPAEARLCDEPPPGTAVRWRGAQTCVLAIPRAPRTTEERGRRIPLDGARLTTSSGADASAVRDGRLETHWTQAVDQDTTGWLQVDLPAPRRIGGLVIRLAGHLGEYPRLYRVETSADGHTWTPLSDVRIADPPLAQLLIDPEDLEVEIEFPPIETRHLRLVRPVARRLDVWLWSMWPRWGIHELDLYEPPSP